MNKRQLLCAVLALLATGGLTSAKAGSGADPVVGTWRLDVGKSNFGSDPAPKSQTRTYTQSGPRISLVMTTVRADGKEATTKSTYQLDGKDYPVIGSPDYDSLSARQVDSHTAEFILKKDGKRMGTTMRTVSPDGKTLTTRSRTTLASGEKSEQILVFNRQ